MQFHTLLSGSLGGLLSCTVFLSLVSASIDEEQDAGVAVPVRRHMLSGEIGADGSIDISDVLVKSSSDLSANLVRNEQSQDNGNIEIANGLADSTLNLSAIPVRKAPEGQVQITADGSIKVSNDRVARKRTRPLQATDSKPNQCKESQEVIVKECNRPAMCTEKRGTIISWKRHFGSDFIVVEGVNGTWSVPSWKVWPNAQSVCGFADLTRGALSTSSLVLGEDIVKPWLDALAQVRPLRRLLVASLRVYTGWEEQRLTNRGDVSCLLPALAARRWPRLNVIVYEQIPDFADFCRSVLAHNELEGSVQVVSIPMYELAQLHISHPFDATVLLGNERPLFEASPDFGGLNYLLSSLHNSVFPTQTKKPQQIAQYIPKLATVNCAPIAGHFLRGVTLHHGFDLSYWPVPREVPLSLSLSELQFELLASPREVAVIEFGNPNLRSTPAVTFDVRNRQVDALGCWAHYVAPDLSLLQDQTPAPHNAQVVYLLKKSWRANSSLTLHTDFKGEAGERSFQFRIPSFLDTASPSQNKLEVENYHWWMLHDRQRGEAYNEAIQKFIRPSHVALDIGTGSGLLAMMALRAGAAHVHAFEVKEAHARLAERIVKRNGYANKITIHNRMSTSVGDIADVGLTLRADALVTETVGQEAGLGEGIIDTISHAKRTLLKPGAVIIPAKMRVWGQLAELPLAARNMSGVDVRTPFLAFQPQMRPASWPRHMTRRHETLSDPFILVDLDFMAEDMNTSNLRSVEAEVTRDSTIHGILTWFELMLDPKGEIVISSRPANQPAEWAPFREEGWPAHLLPLHVDGGASTGLMAPLEVNASDKLRFLAQQEGSKLVFHSATVHRVDEHR